MTEKQLSKEKAEEISRVFGKEVLAELETSGKTLEDIDVVFKDFGHIEAEPPVTETVDASVKELIAELIGSQGSALEAVLAAGKELKAEKAAREADKVQYTKSLAALDARLAPIEAAYGERPRSASDSKDTELTAGRIAAIEEAAKEQATTKNKFWNTTVTQEGV